MGSYGDQNRTAYKYKLESIMGVLISYSAKRWILQMNTVALYLVPKLSSVKQREN